MMLFYNNNNKEGKIQDEEFVRLGKKHGSPRSTTPRPTSRRSTTCGSTPAMGFDLVTFSGGKGIRGPQSAGTVARQERS